MATLTATDVWRDYIVPGVPSSGNQKPSKVDIRTVVNRIDNAARYQPIADRATLAVLDTAIYTLAFLTEVDREGPFEWYGVSLVAEVSADPNQYNYVPPAGDASGASGSWVRVGPNITRGSDLRPLTRIMRDTPPSIIDYGGVGDEVLTDTAAARACLDAYGICHLPWFQKNADSPAVWNFETPVELKADQKITCDTRRPNVKQGVGVRLFEITGSNAGIENMIIDPRGQTGASNQESIYIDTSVVSIQNTRIKNIVWGMGRDWTTLLPGYDFLADANHGSNLIIDFGMKDSIVMGALGNPFVLRNFFAKCVFDSVDVDWTRQLAAPAVPGWDVVGGEGIFWRYCAVQGVGSTGVGNALSHGWSCVNGAALEWMESRGDVCGGNAFKIDGTAGPRLRGCFGSLCGEEQYLIDGVSNLEMFGCYAGGRSGQVWAPAAKSGIRLVAPVNSSGIYDTRAVSCTGSGVDLDGANSNVVSGLISLSNLQKGIVETNASNFNNLSDMTFNANTLGNGTTTGANTTRANLLLASGAGVDHLVGAAAW